MCLFYYFRIGGENWNGTAADIPELRIQSNAAVGNFANYLYLFSFDLC